MKHLASFALLLLSGMVVQAQQPTPQSIDNAVKEALTAWHVPGVAIAIVKDGQLVYLKGHGVRDLGNRQPVTPDTVFPIASCSKSFTSLALGLLVDEGKLDWDDLVRKHLPWFRLGEPLADTQVTLRDLLTHRTGLARHELLWYHAPWNFEERVRRIGFIKPEKPFRAAFEYQSILYGVAGYAAGKAVGSSWHELVRDRIVQPLGMKRTTFTTDAALRLDDVATPHKQDSAGQVKAIPWYRITEPDPAGSINSTARDLASFLQLQLSGSWNGARFISAAALAEPQTPQMAIRPDNYVRMMNPETLQVSYGMGWVIQDYRGEMLLMHGGVIDGFRAHFTLLPRRRIGIALLNNLHGTQMNLALSNTLVDAFAGLEYRDWHGYYRKIVDAETTAEAERRRSLRDRRMPNAKPSRELSAYCGDFHDDAYGSAKINLEQDQLVLHWSNFVIPMEHYHYDTFLVNNAVITDAPAQFILNTDGDVTTLKLFNREFRRRP